VVLLAAVDADSVLAVLPTVLIVLGCTVLAVLFSRDG
jgi:hypothetical protein